MADSANITTASRRNLITAAANDNEPSLAARVLAKSAHLLAIMEGRA